MAATTNLPGLLVTGCAAQPDVAHAAVCPAVGDPSASFLLLAATILGLCGVIFSLRVRLAHADSFKEGFKEGGSVRDAPGRWCTCGCWLGPPRAQRDVRAQAVPFQAGTGAWPIYAAPVVAPQPDADGAPAFGWAACVSVALIVVLFWAAAAVLSVIRYMLSPSAVVRIGRGTRMRARAMSMARRPAGLECAFGLPPGLCLNDGARGHGNASSTAPSACSIEDVGGDDDAVVDCVAHVATAVAHVATAASTSEFGIRNSEFGIRN